MLGLDPAECETAAFLELFSGGSGPTVSPALSGCDAGRQSDCDPDSQSDYWGTRCATAFAACRHVAPQ